MEKFTGVLPACVTPFYENGDVNPDAVGKLIGKFSAEGLDGVYMTGSTGEFPLLTADEREIITKAACEAAKGKMRVISHVGASSLRETLRLAEYSAKCGADALSSVAPFYFPYSFDEVKTFYTELAAVGLPVIIYNIPQRTGVSMTVDQIIELSQIKNIVGMKHTVPDMFFLEQVKTRAPYFNVISGPDEMFISALAMGADACIGSTYNVQGKGHKKIFELFTAGKNAEALEWQKKANDVIAVMIKTGVIQAVKYVLKRQGVDCGECRKPMKALTADQKLMLDAVCDKYGL